MLEVTRCSKYLEKVSSLIEPGSTAIKTLHSWELEGQDLLTPLSLIFFLILSSSHYFLLYSPLLSSRCLVHLFLLSLSLSLSLFLSLSFFLFLPFLSFPFLSFPFLSFPFLSSVAAVVSIISQCVKWQQAREVMPTHHLQRNTQAHGGPRGLLHK